MKLLRVRLLCAWVGCGLVATIFAAASASDAASPLGRLFHKHHSGASCGDAACSQCTASQPCDDCDDLVSVWVKESQEVDVVKYRRETRTRRRRVVQRRVAETVVVPEQYVDHVYHDDVRLVPRTHARAIHRVETRPHTVAVPVAERHETHCVRVWRPTCQIGEVAVDYGRYVRVPCEPCSGGDCGTCCGCRARLASACGSSGGGRTCGGARGGGYGVNPRYFVTPYGRRTAASGGCGDAGCSSCGSHGGGCPGYHQVWEPDIHVIKAPVPGMAYSVEERYAGVMRIVCQTADLRVLPVRDYVFDEVLEKRATTRRIPVTKTRMVERVVYHDEPEEIIEEVSVQVPYTVRETVEVWVRKEMPRCEAAARKLTTQRPVNA